MTEYLALHEEKKEREREKKTHGGIYAQMPFEYTGRAEASRCRIVR